MKKLNKIIERGLCTGCGLCVSSPESMLLNANGYLRPSSPIMDELTLKNCPAININISSEKYYYHPLWGAIATCHQGYSNNSTIRRLGSSGGVLTQIATTLLENHEIDGVIHIGADKSNPTLNQVIISTDPDAVLKQSGSRYAPSAPLSIIRSLLGNGKKYAVIGKPCDIAALRSLTLSNPEAKEQFRYLLSFFCAGIPSQQSTTKILQKLNVIESDVDNFRYRGNGWPGLTTATLKNGTECTMTYNEAWGKILNQSLQTRCKLCPDGIGEAADIVCADAWEESEDGYPNFNEREGLSLVICRTKIGTNLKDQLMREKKITLEAFDIETLKSIQPYQATRKATSLTRNIAFFLCQSFMIKSTGLHLVKAGKSLSLRNQLRIFLGSVKRFIRIKNDS